MKSSKSKRYKALLIDVDGTLVPNRRDGMPSKQVAEAISKVSERIHVGLATSRPYFMLEEIIRHLKLSGPSIINGGAQILDLPSKKILWEKTIDINDFIIARQVLERLGLNYFIHDDDQDIRSFEGYKPKRPFNIICMGLDNTIADITIKELSHLSNISVVKATSWHKGKVGFLISHPEATKQHAIFEVAKILGIETHEIIGVGDGYNDFPLLMACGLKVAMGNAVEDLKAIADYVAPSVEDDGVADIIEKFILNT